MRTLRQRTKADRQDQWWKRAQWAIDLSLSDDDQRRATGLAGVSYLAGSELAGQDETEFITRVIAPDVASIPPLVSAVEVSPEPEEAQ